MGLIEIVFLGRDTSMLEPLLKDAAGMKRDLGRDGWGSEGNIHSEGGGGRAAFVQARFALGGRDQTFARSRIASKRSRMAALPASTIRAGSRPICS